METKQLQLISAQSAGDSSGPTPEDLLAERRAEGERRMSSGKVLLRRLSTTKVFLGGVCFPTWRSCPLCKSAAAVAEVRGALGRERRRGIAVRMASTVATADDKLSQLQARIAQCADLLYTAVLVLLITPLRSLSLNILRLSCVSELLDDACTAD